MQSPPGVTTIWRILTRAGVITPEPRKRPKRSWIRFESDLPNECWQADFTHVTLANGTDVEVLLWVDDHSRYLLSATAHPRVTGPIVVATFRAACTIHGTPQSTLTDNGFVFTTSRTRNGPNGFEVLLACLGVTQKNGRPHHPQTQGKVERLNATLKKWLAARPAAATVAELQALLDEFTDLYNHRRKHRSLNRRRPAEIYAARAKASPDHNAGGHFRVRMLIHDLQVIVINRDTGEILRELTIDPTKDSQPRGVKPGPRPGHRKGGMPKGYKFPKK